ncbi:acetate--CoA ligase [ADP-forming] II subunit alpha [Nanoarchaeota archaeon]
MVVYVYTNGGGEGVLATDALEQNNILLQETPEDIKEKLKQILPSFSSFHNPIDTTAQANEDQYIKGLEILLNDYRTEGIISIVLPQLSFFTEKFPEKVSKIINKKPLVFVVYGGGFTEQIKISLERYAPVFESPEDAVKSLRLLLTLKERNLL